MRSLVPSPNKIVPLPVQLPAKPANGPDSARALDANNSNEIAMQSPRKHDRFDLSKCSMCFHSPQPGAMFSTLVGPKMLHEIARITIYPHFHPRAGMFGL